ncbi:MAG: arginine repressor [Ruminococcus sp.]|nr:arginine repressor [Ruminococcus sp.]
MKNNRHELIIRLVTENPVSTQEELCELLAASGCTVTQATVSRDIRELSLIKSSDGEGGFRYCVPALNRISGRENDGFYSILHDAVLSADHALNTVVVKTHTGMAQAVCAKLDRTELENVVGTIAGDDTIFILMRTERDAARLVKELETVLNKK